ncbi:DUF5522 domain-containing protein [Halobacteriovorax sp. XZX-3]|uniref:DUF5522 domain-containing protein n=1 Tax=unclassified Halobacteriovorax TaxID=2639665 RepID=UPI000CD316AD|nr:DUF5522 domain-containing protein [Halobacteriovorax sp. DA5]POB13366.1 hypothetical protein C0Z22_09385 [Halobacteriovorax sp. DA5]
MDKAKLTYTNEQGREVKTSQFLKNRGSCCKTSCLHCPYGFTLNKHGIQSQEISVNDITKAQAIVDANQQESLSVASSLMGAAFGGSKPKKLTITESNSCDFAFVELKGEIFGLIEKGGLQAKKLYLKEQFKEQGLDLDTVNSVI